MYGIYSMVVRKTQKGQSFGGNKEAIDRVQALAAQRMLRVFCAAKMRSVR